ncbi:MAG: DEAD/DEAH box helicase [Euryarchaeota archaeon]|nr:DEAD/DEAH box helicase [Euryarchaeota archaeon]
MFVAHPLVRENAIESRLYQEVIVGNAAKGNTLVVAPTALGKTVIAILLAAHRLAKFPESKILMISTTRPLVNQHAASFKKFLKAGEGEVNVFTGHTPPEERDALWKKSKIVCATPQVIENDLISGRYPLADVSLVIFDEAHRCTGDYPYSFIAKKYREAALQPLILALTASPGGEEEKIGEVCEKLFIENIEVRTERDPDVRPYIKGIEIEWRSVELPEDFEKIKLLLESVLKERLENLKKLGAVRSSNINIPKKELLVLRGKLQEELAKAQPAPELYIALSQVAACINVAHAIELLETQGLTTLAKYFKRVQKGSSKAVKNLLGEVKFMRAVRITENLSQQMHHPKLDVLAEIVEKEKGKQMIVFSQYRDSAQKIVERLDKIDGIKPVRFVGQASKEEDKGLTQKQQLDILEKFRSCEYNVLVATSVGEEGLDIPKVDLVIFYEPIPSEIRSIQRRGRTGRSRAGRVIVLMTKKTRDEWFYWSSFRKEKRMHSVLESLKNKYYKPLYLKEKEQKQLQDFFEKSYNIIVDSRELSSAVARELLEFGIISKPRRLEVGDYILSDRVCVERKTAEDFLQSIVDKRLLEQVLRLRQTFQRPVLIIEGEGLYSKRDIHPNAIRGALAAIAVDFGVPILFTKDEKETAAMIASIVRREHEEREGEVQIRGEKRVLSLEEQQEYVVAGLPKVNITIARRLLEEFKSVQGIFNASEEELEKVRGIGRKIAEEIRKVIASRYER